MGALLPLMLLAPLLVAVGLSDLRHMRIPNLYSQIAVGVFVLMLPFGLIGDPLARIIAAGLVLALGFAAFALGKIGGGDVKFLSALMLFVPVSTLGIFAYVFAFALALGIASILLLRRAALLTGIGWQAFGTGEQGFPMGISIALAGLLHPLVKLALIG